MKRLTGTVRGPFVVAHRGASEDAPENTLPAFEAALETGCEVLECDVQLSRDGEVVVIHDATLQRTTDGAGRVAEWRWVALRKLDAGYPERFGGQFAGTGLPRLEDVLALARGQAEVMVEIKADAVGPEANGVESRCLEAARRTEMTDRIAIISMESRAIMRVKQGAPQVRTGLVFRRHRQRWFVRDAVAAGADYLIAHRQTLLSSPRICAAARAAGVRVGAYVVNDRASLGDLVLQGVESLATDRPAAMITALTHMPLRGEAAEWEE